MESGRPHLLLHPHPEPEAMEVHCLPHSPTAAEDLHLGSALSWAQVQPSAAKPVTSKGVYQEHFASIDDAVLLSLYPVRRRCHYPREDSVFSMRLIVALVANSSCAHSSR